MKTGFTGNSGYGRYRKLEGAWGLIGYADIATTLGYYTHFKFNDVEKEVRELEKKLAGE